MPTEDMPITAFAILFLFVGSVGVIGAIFTALLLSAVYRERRDIRRAKAIAQAKKEMKDRTRRLKEQEAKKSAIDDSFFTQYKEFIDGL